MTNKGTIPTAIADNTVESGPSLNPELPSYFGVHYIEQRTLSSPWYISSIVGLPTLTAQIYCESDGLGLNLKVSQNKVHELHENA